MIRPCHGCKELERIGEKKERRRRGRREMGEQFSPIQTLERERKRIMKIFGPKNI
jgi:hypothetical protein